MKKLLLSAIICSMVIGLAGCGTDGGDDGSEPGSAVSSLSSSTVSSQLDTEGTVSVSQADSDENQSEYIKWRGIMLYRPGNFTGEDVFATNISSGKISTDDTVYLYLQDTGSVSDQYNAGTYSLEDVPETYSNAVYKIVDEFFPSYREDYTMTVDTEKKVDVLGTTFLRRTGTIHCEEYKEVADLYYAAYYGIVDTPGMLTEDCPVVWLTFAECTDEKTKDDVEQLVDKMAETATFDEEDLKNAQEYWSKNSDADSSSTETSSSEEESSEESSSEIDTETEMDTEIDTDTDSVTAVD